MTATPTTEVLALVREREGYARMGEAMGVSLVDEQLALRGFMVDAKGDLVEYVEPKRKPAKKSAPAKEKAVAKAPERAVED